MDITDSAFHKIINAGVNDTGDKLSPVSLLHAIHYYLHVTLLPAINLSLVPRDNLSPVSVTPVNTKL
jgi:hypothetical protein